jgi:TetR/AcrR family transcriptional regulator, cholesterol catabolism regulator
MRNELREFKKSRIIDEASRLFYENGYEATSLDELASTLSVTKPFIYSHFENKLAILEAVYERSTARLIANVQNEVNRSGPAADRLEKFIIVFVKENIEQQISSAVFLQEEKHLSKRQLKRIRDAEGAFNELLAKLLQSGIKSGDFHVEDVKLASLSISGMVRWVHRWYRPDGRLGADEIAERMAKLALNLVGYQGD